MLDHSTANLVLLLIGLIVASAFFSISETAIFSLNRIQLRALADKKIRPAQLVARLLSRPDRLMGLILIGNNAINILAAIVAGIIFSRIFGEDAGIWATTLLMTIIMLLFAELTPKTYAAIHPQRIAFFNIYLLAFLMTILKIPIIAINAISNALVRLFGVDPTKLTPTNLSRDDLKVALKADQSKSISPEDKSLIINAMELGAITVDEIIIPKNDIYGLDINADTQSKINTIQKSPFTRIPVYENSLDNIVGVLHIRSIISALNQNFSHTLSKESIRDTIRTPLFINEQTTLAQQLIRFRESKERLGFVVNEHGEIQGLITIDNLLEQIVGAYTTNDRIAHNLIKECANGKYDVSGNISIREFNKITNWDLDGAYSITINGMILEYLQRIPKEKQLCCKIGDYLFEITEINPHGIERVLVHKQGAAYKEKVSAVQAY